MNSRLNDSIEILRYCAKSDFKGWDPYDILNSRIIATLVPQKAHFILWVCIQMGKSLPVNFRKVLLVPKTHNAKGIALFIMGICNYWNVCNSIRPELKKYLDRLILILRDLKDPTLNSWGYGFLWVARGKLRFDADAPNVVVSYFVYSALEKISNLEDYEPPVNIQEWIFPHDLLKVLRRTMFDEGPMFSYSAFEGNEGVFNASLFASFIFAKSSIKLDDLDKDFLVQSIKTIENCIKEDGSLVYGQKSFQKWVDNYHTLYVIEAGIRLNKETEFEFNQEKLEKMIKFYRREFLKDKKFPLFLNKSYVMDYHALGQLLRMTEFEIYEYSEIKQVLNKWQSYFKNSKYPFRIYTYGINRINYLRWTQAFMFYGLSFFNTREYEKS